MGFPSVCCEYHWLINNCLVLAQGIEVGRGTKLKAGRKKAESERCHVAPLEPEETLPGKPQPHGDTQINRNGLN